MRRPLASAAALAALFLLVSAQTLSLPDPLICEDTIDGTPPFKEIGAFCLLGCDCVIVAPTGGLLPGQVNTTCIPYCNLDCVHEDATPAMSALAPDCWDRCQVQLATPENTGWCMYWCVEGYTDLVTSVTCTPSETFGSITTTMFGGITESYRPFSFPPAWQSWYLTQTVIPRTSNQPTTPITTFPSLSTSSLPSQRSVSPTVSSTTNGPTAMPSSSIKSSTPTVSSAQADSASASSSTTSTNMAISISHADHLLLTVLLLSLYLTPRIAWY